MRGRVSRTSWMLSSGVVALTAASAIAWMRESVHYTDAVQGTEVTYHYRLGRCLNAQGETGTDKGRLGECGDFSFRSARKLRRIDAAFKGAQLQQASIRFSNFNGADFTAAQARGLQLLNVRFDHARFTGADLRGLKSVQGSWRQTDFRGSDLRGARFYQDVMVGCDFRGSDLREAVLLASSLEGSLFDSSTRLPFSKEVALTKGMKDVTGHSVASQSAN